MTRADEQPQRVEVVRDDTLRARVHFPEASFDVVVADLPYGVQHGSTAGAALTRSAEDLLRDALPVWRSLVRRGGAIALAWNARTTKRATVVELLDASGFNVDMTTRETAFEHRVDRSITRDLVVGVAA